MQTKYLSNYALKPQIVQFRKCCQFSRFKHDFSTNRKSTKLIEIHSPNLIEGSEFKNFTKVFLFENFEISDEKYFHLRVLKVIENLKYITKYERYEDEPKSKNVAFNVFFATLLTKSSLDHFSTTVLTL